MGSKHLKGLTIKFEGDTSDLYDSLNKIEKKGRSLSGELGQINKALKLDPSNTELLAQKQKVLADAVSNTEKKLDTLRNAEKQVQEQFEHGEASEEQVRALRREIIEATSRLNRYKEAAKEAAEAEDNIVDKAQKAGKSMRDQSDNTRRAEQAAKDMDDAASDLATGGLAAMTGAATATVAAIIAMAEESREYRTEMSKLDTSFKASEHEAATATQVYKTLQGVIGETDQSVEAAQQIALLAKSEKDAAEWAGLAAGLIGRMGDALQPETFYEGANETLKLSEATGAYVQLLEGCGEDVEAFNEGLAACSTEQEKQEYMLTVTKQLLGSAAEQYRLTNAEVIRANEATEKWNASTARIGSIVEPTVTDIKALGATLLDDLDEPLENAAELIRKDVIPAIKNFSSGVKSNMPTIKAGVVGVTTALVALKVVTVTNTVAQKGFAASLKTTAIAQKALNIAKSATPWGFAAVAVAGVTSALIAYTAATKNAKTPVSILTEAEHELMEAAKEAAAAFQEQKKAQKEAFGNITAEMDYVQELADELQRLADASGRVQETDRDRAEFILNELNAALDTEYAMVGDVIQQYDKLKSSIDETIKSKTASLLLDSLGDSYTTAIQNEDEAYEAMAAAEKAFDDAAAALSEAERLEASARTAYDDYVETYGTEMAVSYEQALADAMNDTTDAENAFASAKATYEEFSAEYAAYRETILQYQAAQAAFLSDNYDQAVELMTTSDEIFSHYSTLPADLANELLDLEIDALNAKKKIEEIEEGIKSGSGEYTQEMLSSANKNYEDIMRAYATAYADAYTYGEDLGRGLCDGSAASWASAYNAGVALFNAYMAGANDAADRHSPARETIKFGEDLGKGAVIGSKNKTKELKQAGSDQAAAIIAGYREQEVSAQRALLSIADQQAVRQVAGQMTAATATSPILEGILSAIEQGQVLVIDGDAVVGATAGKMDSALGRRRVLTSRGAM